MPRITTTSISGVEVEVHCSAQGLFSIHVPGEEQALVFAADSYQKAVAQARPKLAERKVRVAIRFFTKTGQRGEATGIHAKTGAVLAKLDGKSYQLSNYGERKVFRADIPPEKLSAYSQLDVEIRERQRQQREIERAFAIDIADVTRRAIQTKAEEVARANE